jgi:hypothetical protein
LAPMSPNLFLLIPASSIYYFALLSPPHAYDPCTWILSHPCFSAHHTLTTCLFRVARSALAALFRVFASYLSLSCTSFLLRIQTRASSKRIALLVNCFMLVSCVAYSSALKMEAKWSSETLVDFQQTTLRYIPEDRTYKFYF